MGPASSNDAAHIAVATVSNVDMVVSWNFKHIVHFENKGVRRSEKFARLRTRGSTPRRGVTP